MCQLIERVRDQLPAAGEELCGVLTIADGDRLNWEVWHVERLGDPDYTLRIQLFTADGERYSDHAETYSAAGLTGAMSAMGLIDDSGTIQHDHEPEPGW